MQQARQPQAVLTRASNEREPDMSTPRTTRRQTRRAAGVIASTVRTSSRARERPSLAKATVPWGDSQMRVLDKAELERGPLAVDSELERSSALDASAPARAAAGGIPLRVTVRLHDRGNDCAPWVGAQVDVWRLYPGGRNRGDGAPGEALLAGQQITGDDGSVTFETTYPSSHRGRAVSMKLRIRTSDDQSRTFSWKTRVLFTHPQERASAGSEAIALSGSDGEGYAGTVDIALDTRAAVSRTPANAERAPARLLHAHVERSGARRTLAVTIEARQRTALSVRLAGPSGQLLVRRRATVALGTHTLRAEIPARAHAGAARLALAMSTDTATEHRHLRIPMPQSGM
jgi:hypothetical protein